MDCLDRLRKSKIIIIVLVSSMLLIDYMLLFAIVPVIPTFLWKEHLRTMPVLGSTVQPTTLQNVNITNHSNVTTVSIKSLKTKENEFLATQSLKIGGLLASKPAVQIVANIFIGPLIDRIGYSVPLFFGTLVIGTTAIVFALGQVFPVLLVSAAIQGIGSSCAMAGGMSLLASKYTDDVERGRAIGYALGAIGFGALMGPPYGSVLNAFTGKTTTFMILAGIIIAIAIFQLFCTGLKIEKRSAENKATSLSVLFRDPYIILAASSVLLVNINFGALNAGFTVWLIRRFHCQTWVVGLAFIPITFAYVVTTNVAGLSPSKFPRWFATGLGVLVNSIGCLCLPFSTSFVSTIGPALIMGIGCGLVEANVFPLLANLVDSRHKLAYGSVYAISDISLCIAFITGPLVAGAVVRALSFSWMMWIIAIAMFLFAPLLILLRSPPSRSEEGNKLLDST